MSELTLLASLAVVGAIIVTALVRRARRIRVSESNKGWRPADLRDAELVYRERTFKAKRPLQLVARVDRAYRRPNGIVVLVELKTRGAATCYLSDIIELSAQRVALEGETGERVGDVGYVVVERGFQSERTVIPVKLMRVDEIVALARRRELILARPAAARRTNSKRLCDHCSYQRECRML